MAGACHDTKCCDELSVLEDCEGFKNKFLTENEMLRLAAAQDYLLMLYDHNWDPRLESAVLYLAARVNRPVVVYGGSWSGRMVKEYCCGLLADNDREIVTKMLKHIPLPGSVEYTELLDGMNDFGAAHSAGALRELVIRELLG